jgi:hypothetical protein
MWDFPYGFFIFQKLKKHTIKSKNLNTNTFFECPHFINGDM